jgi:DNA-binding response OmpR family regulator/anti-sigma regulatory factor (Ser/Thr protein kinase)
MDFRKLDNQQMPLQVRPANLPAFIEDTLEGFRELACSRSMDLDFRVEGDWDTDILFDEGVMDKILFNLLSNAFKYTPESGSIRVTLRKAEDAYTITVSDTGIGIPEENIDQIFNRFFSSGSPIYKNSPGTGIGLSLTRKLVLLHHGTIEVESSVGKGTTFTVRLSSYEKSYPPEERHPGVEEKESYKRKDPPGTQSPAPGPGVLHRKADRPLILIAEDNDDLRRFLSMSLSEYSIVEAINGKQGIELALQYIPDIIISDIMMPEADGFALCNQVKSNFITCHVPIILLTAKTTIDSKIKGLETGADAYIEKPFDIHYLHAQLANLLSQRNRLKGKYSNSGEFLKELESISPLNQQFLDKISSIIRKHISNPELSIETIGAEIGMSRTQVFRKFKALSNRPPSEYIRITRLKYAVELLEKGEMNINEIASETGFASASYFITCFKKYFGKTPGEYIEHPASRGGNTPHPPSVY